jgi:hypothetical protein
MQYGKTLYALLATLAISATALGQTPKSFSETPSEFLTQFDQFVNAGKQPSVKETYDRFAQVLPSYDADKFKAVREAGNAMLGLKMGATPYFVEYMETLLALQTSGDFGAFHKVLASMLQEGNKNTLRDYLKFSKDLFAYNALEKGTSDAWIVTANSYITEYKNGELSLRFTAADLMGYRKNDTMRITQTSGLFFPFKGEWQGDKGRASWERAGLGKEVFCTFEKYALNVKRNECKADNALLTFPLLFGTSPLKGSFEDKVVVQSASSDKSYPRFLSNEKVLKIDNVGAGVRYVGGFKLEGNTIYGNGDAQRKATILYTDPKTNKKTLRASSRLFVIDPNIKIWSENADCSIYFDKDSLQHPAAQLRFDLKKKELTLSRGEQGNNRNPFFDSYHNIQIGTDKVSWQMDSDSIFFDKKSYGLEKDNIFESVSSFSEQAYRGLQGVASKNPVAEIKRLTDDVQTMTVPALDIARSIKPTFNVASIQSLLGELTEKGFIKYDPETEMVEVQPKLIHYAKAAVKKADYDAISILSRTKGTNGLLHLGRNKELVINAVRFIELSTKRQVAIKPLGEQVTMLRDRDIDFDGQLYAGLSTFEGKDLHFKYAPFKVQMDSIRYFDLFHNSGRKDEKEQPIAMTIASRIEHLSGVLAIDDPENKSGIKDAPTMPSFTRTGGGYIYYDVDEKTKPYYKRDSFYFKLDDFTMDNLGAYMPTDIQLPGSMVAAEIFPPFKENAVLLDEDQSLGFLHQTPAAGYTMYRNRGLYKGEIGLNNSGFRGKGTIEYLGASLRSEDIIFRPKQLTCTANSFGLEEKRGGLEVPQVRGAGVSVDWRALNDSMYVTSQKGEDFKLFKTDGYTMKGNLILTPGGVFGSGLFDWGTASLSSDLLLFGANSVRSDTSNVSIRSLEAKDNIVFDSKNVKSDVDFDKGIGKFFANDKIISTSMPYNQYMTSMSEFAWDMKKGIIDFKSPGIKGTFLSTHPDQDSLAFLGSSAQYDYNTSGLAVQGVEYIQSADANIYTSDGKVEIGVGAKMKTLENAKIVASRENQHHVIKRATVEVKGKKDFTANGYYEYKVGDKQQEILFSNIVGARIGKGQRSEKATATRASGEVTEDDNFYIDYKTKYQGTINLSSNEKALEFVGFAQLDSKLLTNKSWFSLRSKADKADLAISFDEPKSPEGYPIRCGLFVSREFSETYPAVMMPTFFRNDRTLLDARGIFKYDKAKDSYIFGDSLKVMGNALRGNKMTFNDRSGKIEAEGSFQLGHGLRDISVEAVGRASTAFIPVDQRDTLAGLGVAAPTELDLMASIDFPFPEKVLQIMINDISNTSFEYKDVELSTDEATTKMLAEWFPDKKQYEEAYKQLTTYKYFDLPKDKNSTIFFSKLPMKWDGQYQSFISKDTKIGIGSINKRKINGLLDCYVQFGMPSNMDDGLYIYIQLPNNGNYYFFGYKKGFMNVVSSNTTFNAAVEGLKKKEKMLKTKNGDIYEIAPVNPGSAQFFINRVKESWGRK